jgi:hypothetical protein
VEAHVPTTTTPAAAPRQSFARRLSTETKHAFKTTEFWVYIGLLIALLIAGTVDNSEGSQFGADDVWLYATLLTIGYLISRGLAKSGSRDPYWDSPDAGGSDSSLTDRVKTAAQVLADSENAQSGAGTTTHNQR